MTGFFPSGLCLYFDDDASILDVINAVDQTIREKCGEFPVKGFKCLMEMVYHPVEGRFYNQVAVQAYVKSGIFLSIEKTRECLSLMKRRQFSFHKAGEQLTGKNRPDKQWKKGNLPTASCTPSLFL